ncbi:MAG TPA: hypothetical protein VF281_00100 [Candidatus Saccharimonadales bacterium]
MGIFNKKLKIAAQIQAESDAFLFECFHNDGVIEQLVDNRFELIAGRKGTGKTAIARYLQQEHLNYGIDYATRLTLTDLQTTSAGITIDGDNLLKFLAITTAQRLLKKKHLTKEGEEYWEDYLTTHGLQGVSSYSEWAIKAKSVFEKKSATLGIKPILGANLSHDETSEYTKQIISESTSSLFSGLSESLKHNTKVMIIIDDITDQFDSPGTKDVRASMDQIKYVLHQLHNFNTKFNDDNIDLTFVCTIRNDLWEYILGSNENKLIHNCLWLEWNEKSFCEMLIKRLPHFANNLEDALLDPFKSIKDVFPDEVFDEVMNIKGVSSEEIKQYRTKFYAYVQLISFNRPRDFLRLCHAMKTRLSEVKPIEFKHIKASEIEYTEYFYNELKDELNIFAKILNIDIISLMTLMAKLATKSKLSYQELKAMLSVFIKASHSSTTKFITDIWNYSLIGIISNSNKDYAHFKHNQGRNSGYNFPQETQMKEYYFLLHRGLYWKYHPFLDHDL